VWQGGRNKGGVCGKVWQCVARVCVMRAVRCSVRVAKAVVCGREVLVVCGGQVPCVWCVCVGSSACVRVVCKGSSVRQCVQCAVWRVCVGRVRGV